MRQGEQALEVRLVDLVRDDRGALVDEGAQTARVIDVVVRVDDVANRLAGNEPLRLGDDLVRARLALRPLEDDDVVAEVDGEGCVTAENQEDAVGDLLGGHSAARRSACRAAPAGAAAAAPCGG